MSKNPFNLTTKDIMQAFEEFKLPTRNTSSALDNLQGYGPVSQTPNWNIHDHNTESSLTPTYATSFTPLDHINLASVEEEDEWIYGGSNSVPEEQISVKKDPVKEEPVINNPGRFDSGWSDEEDPYSEISKTAHNKLNSRLRENIPDCDSENKILETKNLSGIYKKVPEIDDPLKGISEQEYVAHGVESDSSTLSQRIEKNQFFEVNHPSYVVATELLKKRNAEKMNSSNKNECILPEISKNESALDDKSVSAGLKTDKLPSKRQAPTLIRKHVDNIRDYLTSSRKRTYPLEEFPPEKYPRYESSRNSPQKFSPTYCKSKVSYGYSESDRIKYSTSSSRHRSPSYESERYHSRYVERRHSPSPKGRSRTPDYRHHRRSPERSTDYNRFKNRNPKSRRSRSKSPRYYSSRSKTYKKMHKSSKKPDRSRKKEKSNYSSGDSFCSLSLGSSSSSSSDSSDESSEEEKKSKKRSVKTIPKDNKKYETEMANLKGFDDIRAKEPEPNDFSKKLSDMLDVKNSNLNNEFLDPANHKDTVTTVPSKSDNFLLNFINMYTQPLVPHQLRREVAPDSLTFPSPNINIPSSLQMPVISSEEHYVYPPIPAASAQYVAPQITDFSQMIPSAAFPAPVMAAPSPAGDRYESYFQVPPVPSNESQYVSNAPKNIKVRPSALKTVHPLASSAPSSNITIIPNVPDQKPVTKLKIQESNNVEVQKIQETKKSVDQKNNLKEKSFEKIVHEKNSVSSKPIGESTSEQNKLLIIEKYKKMKIERAKAITKSNSASEDLDEMRKTLEETFGKKISVNEKLLYTKCKNQFNLSLDISNQATKDARRSGENLSNFKSKLPTALQAEVSKIKLEPYKDETVTNEIISCLDQGDHTCTDCFISFANIKEFINHIQAPEHKEQMEMSKQDWKKYFVREPKKDDKSDEQKKTVLKPVKGAEFLKPLVGFHCSLCKEIFLEESSAEQHLKTHQHFVSYENFTTKRAPLYEVKRLFKRYIKMVISTRQRNAERKRNQEAAEKKAKEILLKEKSKEITYEELEEKQSGNFPPSNNQVTANIKLNLSEKDDDKSIEKKNAPKEIEKKNLEKPDYIRKAPHYKKVLHKVWNKKDNIRNIKESDVSPSSSNITRSVEKDSQHNQPHEVKPSSPLKKSEKSNHKEDTAELKSTSDNSAYKDSKSSRFENKNSSVKQTVNSNVNASDSPNYKVQLSEINFPEVKIPEVSSLPSSSNANIPQPMDIDNSQANRNKPKSEEEKELLFLGIEREDLQPLVIPIPPPTSMVSYQIPSNVQAFSSNIGSNTTSTCNAIIKSIDFSVPPPNIASYQSNPAPVSVYNKQNNTQNVGPYSYPTSSQIPVYSSPSQVGLQTNYQPIPPFSTPPPAFRNPPPMLPYSNTVNIQPASQFPSSNNLQYNSYSNPIPTNAHNQSYQPSIYSVTSNNQAHFSAPNASQNLAPSSNEYNASSISNFNTVTTISAHVHQSKALPSLKKVGNLTVIVPERIQLKVNGSVNDKLPKSKKIKIKVQNINKIPVNDNIDKVSKTVVNKSKTEKTKNINFKDDVLKTSKIVKPIEKSIYETMEDNEKMNKHNFETEVKCIINECIKKIEKPSIINCSLSESSNKFDKLVEDSKNTEDIINKTNEEIMKKSSDISCSLSGSSSKDEVTENKKNSEDIVTVKTSEKIMEKPSNINCSFSKSSRENDEYSSIKDIVTIKTSKKIMNDNPQDSKITLKENAENVTTDSMIFEDKHINDNDITSDDVLEAGISNINTKNANVLCETNTKFSKEQIRTEDIEIADGIVLEKSSNTCLPVDNSNKNDKVDTENVIANEEIMESTENISSDSVFSKCEQLNIDDKISDINSEVETSNIKVKKVNATDSEETSSKTCEAQMPAVRINIDATFLEKSSNIFCSESNSNKINEVTGNKEAIESTGINCEKIMKSDAQDCKVILQESNETLIFKPMISKSEESNDNKNANKNILSEKSFPNNEKNEDSQLLNVISGIEEENISNLCYNENILSKNMNYVDTHEALMPKTFENTLQASVSIGNAKDSNYHEIYDNKTGNKNNENVYEESMKIGEKQFFADSMKVDVCTDLKKSLNICFSADNSDKTEIKNIDNLCMNRKVLNEDIKNCVIFSEDLDKASEENKNMFQNTDVEIKQINVDSDHMDSNVTDVIQMKNEVTEILNSKCEKGQELKDKINEPEACAFNDYSFSNLPDVTDIETGDKERLLIESSNLMTKNEPVKEKSPNIKSRELFILINRDITESSQIFTKEEKLKNVYTPVENPEDSVVPVSEQVKNPNKSENISQDMHLMLHKNCEDSSILEDEAKMPLQHGTKEGYSETKKSKVEISPESGIKDTETKKSKVEISPESESSQNHPHANLPEVQASTSSSVNSTTRSGRLIRRPKRLGL